MNEENREPQLFRIPLMDDDIECLVEILNFAGRAASVLAHQEIQKGTGVKAAAKYNRMSRDAEDFAENLVKHISMGEPTDGQIH